VVISGDLAIGAYSDGSVVALDALTGALRWERKLGPTGSFMDVDALRLEGGRLYAAAYSGAVYALDPRTGRQEWELRTPSPVRLASGGGALLAVTATQVLGISPQDGSVRWTLPLDGAPWGEPVLLNGLAAVPNTRSLLWIDTVSGSHIRALDPGTGVAAAAARAGRRVYFISNGGSLVALDLVS
jgi:outer membrane protein assembly factor BamB